MKKICVIYGSESSMSWIEDAEYVRSIKGADAILLTGGGDVHPSFYGGMNGVGFTWDKSLTPNHRCSYESEMIDYAISKNIPIIGICRGLQWICVKAGGKLIQDFDGHTHNVGIRSLRNNKLYQANSLHHQLIYPFALDKEDYEIIGVIDNPTGRNYILNGVVIPKIKYEIEIAYFNKINGFGVQFHPEMMSYNKRSEESSKTLDYLNELLHDTIWKK